MVKIVFYFLLLILSTTFFACSSNISKNEEGSFLKADSIRYRIVYYIHGDGSYLYHDNGNNEVQADERMVRQAISVAEELPNSEVFIFHQKPKKHFLFFFPLKDGEIYYFRSGQLIANEKYNSNPSLKNLDIEAAFFREYASYIADLPGKTVKNFFLYYGHEIPETGGTGYNTSYPEKPFSIGNLARAMALFGNMPQMAGSKFDFLLLSTCYNGTPGVISQLSPYAGYIIASPEYLHLSYISSEYLKRLPKDQTPLDLHNYLKNFAQYAFDRLKESTRTMITVTLYDIDKVKKFADGFNFIRAAAGVPQQQQEYQEETGSVRYSGCIDCLQETSFNTRAARQGIDLFYNPPQFGKYKGKLSHSGWGCPR